MERVGSTAEKKEIKLYCYLFGGQFNTFTRTAATPNAYLYNGGVELNEKTNYYETAFRHYDPQIGRFTAIDPLADQFGSWTPYQYAFNDPVYYNDPLGLAPNGALARDNTTTAGGDASNRRFGAWGGLGSVSAFGNNYWTAGVHGASFDQRAASSAIEYKLFSGTSSLDDLAGFSYQRNESGSFSQSKILDAGWFYYDEQKSLSGKESNTKDGSILRLKNLHLDVKRPELLIITEETGENGNDDIDFANILVTAVGSGLSVSSDVYFNERRGNWVGKNFKMYSTSWGGNATTGGKLKFAEKLSTRLKYGGWIFGGYNVFSLLNKRQNGEISEGLFWVDQASNLYSTFGGIYGAAWGLGWSLGRDYGPSKWYGNDETKWFK